MGDVRMDVSVGRILSIAAKVAVGVVLIAVGIAILIFPPSTGHRPALRTLCGMNLSLIGKATAIYSNMYNDKLPGTGPARGGSWLCDQPASVLDQLSAMPIGSSEAGDVRKRYYCPANESQDIATLWGGPGEAVRVTGYVWMNERNGGLMPSLAGVPARIPPVVYHTRFLDTPYAASSELALDWIISPTANPTATVWTGKALRGRAGVYETSHMRSDTQPAGGNVLYFDGHVKFQVFGPAAVAVQQSGGPSAPFFWFPTP